MDLDLSAIVPVFLADSEEGLAAMEEALVALEARPGDAEALGEIFRAVHTLKGDGGSLGFTALAELAHHLEDLLAELRDGRRAVGGAVVSLLLRATDALRSLLAAGARGRHVLGRNQRALLAEVQAALAVPATPVTPVTPVTPTPPAAESRPRPAREGGESAARRHLRHTLRVGVDKLDRLLDLIGEIAVARGRLGRQLADPATPRAAVAEAFHQADALHQDLQDLVQALRMVPVGPSFRRHLRTVRDLAGDRGKRAELEIEGGEVEVDNSVLQMLRDPLIHLLRNAIDHGIETPEARRAAGKDEVGRITLAARYQAGGLAVTLADDGAGLDRKRILASGRALGLVAAGAEPSDRELDQLIFAPGLSTAAAADALSGRGVGMDVVRRNVAALRGSVEIASRPGEGTLVTLRLPLTLTLIDALFVGLGGDVYVIPLEAAIEFVDLPRNGSRREAGGVFRLRDEVVPFVRLRDLLRVGGPPAARESVVVVRGDEGLAGLVVDALVGQGQTVIKPLSRLFHGVPGLSASAILADGRVAFVLDVPGLLQLAGDAAPVVAGGEN